MSHTVILSNNGTTFINGTPCINPIDPDSSSNDSTNSDPDLSELEFYGWNTDGDTDDDSDDDDNKKEEKKSSESEYYNYDDDDSSGTEIDTSSRIVKILPPKPPQPIYPASIKRRLAEITNDDDDDNNKNNKHSKTSDRDVCMLCWSQKVRYCAKCTLSDWVLHCHQCHKGFCYECFQTADKLRMLYSLHCTVCQYCDNIKPKKK